VSLNNGMAKIIPFPGVKLEDIPQKSKEELLHDHIIDTTLDISLNVFNQLDTSRLPYNPYDKLNQLDLLLIHESIKSAIYRLYNKDHSLHEIQFEKMVNAEGHEIKFHLD